MKNKELPDQIKVNVWQSLRTSIGIWQVTCLTLLTTGSTLVISAYGIILANANNLGDFTTAFLSVCLFAIALCLEYMVLRFMRTLTLGITSIMQLEKDIFENEKYEYLRISTLISKNRGITEKKIFKGKFYIFWGAILVLSSGIITAWRISVFLKNYL